MGLESQPMAQQKERGEQRVGPIRGLMLGMALLALGAAGCSQPPAVSPSSASGQTRSEETASLVFEGFKARGTLRGVKQWEAVASHARVFYGSQKAKAEEVEITYFQNGREVSHATARKADIDMDTFDLLAEGDVVVKAANGVVLLTERLAWDNDFEQVRTRSKVRVLKGGSWLTGIGLVADRKLEHVEVQQDIKIEAASVTELRQFEKKRSKPKR